MFFVTQLASLKRQDTHDVVTYSSRYTKSVFFDPVIYFFNWLYRFNSFFNTLWLIVNDMAIGVAFGAFLLENNQVLAELANHTTQVPSLSFHRIRLKNSLFKLLLFHLPRNALYWLDAWPAGLKLNTELSRFYANTFISVIDTWECGYLILLVIFS